MGNSFRIPSKDEEKYDVGNKIWNLFDTYDKLKMSHNHSLEDEAN
jgi:hypothetical protein